MHEAQDMDKMTAEYQQLITAQQTLLLATATQQGIPHLSYAPYVRDQAGCFYIFISKLAAHTTNLLSNSKASIFFIRAEQESQNLFARERINYLCQVQQVVSTDTNYDIQLQALADKFGNVVSMLRSLPDFHLFALMPESGQYIVGFGRAYSIDVATGRLHLMDS